MCLLSSAHALVPCNLLHAMSSNPVAQGAAAALPPWAVPATPPAAVATVGLNADGEFYLYGDVPSSPGPVIPAVRGAVIDLSVIQLGAASRYGLRDYLDIRMVSDTPSEEFRLRLAAKGSTDPVSGEPRLPWSVRSLLGCLLGLDLQATPVKLSPKRGTDATFIRVIPCSPEWDELPECRAMPIGPTRADMCDAVTTIRFNSFSLLPHGRPRLDQHTAAPRAVAPSPAHGGA